MRDNKKYLMIEKDVWESVCSRVAALSQKIRVYEQSHQPAPDYYNPQIRNYAPKMIQKRKESASLVKGGQCIECHHKDI